MTNKRQHLVYLSSAHADNYPVPGQISRYRSNMLDRILIGSDERAFVSVRHANLPHTFHQITDANNKFVMSIGVVDTDIVIPNGSYSGPSLASAATLALEEIYGVDTYLVTYISGESKFNFTALVYASTILFPYGTAHKVFGYNFNDYDALVVGEPKVSPNMAVVKPINMISLHSSLNLHNSYGNLEKGRSTRIECFGATGDFGTTTHYASANNHFRSEIFNNNVQDIEVWLSDSMGNDLVMDPLIPWSVSLLIEVEKR